MVLCSPSDPWWQASPRASFPRTWRAGSIRESHRYRGGRVVPLAEARRSMESTQAEPEAIISGRAARLRSDLVPLYALTATVLCAAGGWYLLKELAPLLRPLTLAVFLAYAILPTHGMLSRRVSARLAGPLVALLGAAAVLALAILVYINLVDLKDDLPRLIERARGLVDGLRTWVRDRLPSWALEPAPEGERAGAEAATRLKALAAGLVNSAAGFLGEALVVGFYLIFLLLEAGRLPRR